MKFWIWRAKTKAALGAFAAKHSRIIWVAAILVAVIPLTMLIYNSVAPDMIMRIDTAREHRRFNNLKKDDFLYDFYYMVNVLEEGFPFFDLLGKEQAAQTRLIIENAPNNINALGFYDILQENFFGNHDIGSYDIGNRNFGNLTLQSHIELPYLIWRALSGDSFGPAVTHEWRREVFKRETITFYDALSERELGRNLVLASRPNPILHNELGFDITEDENIAYLRMGRMFARGSPGYITAANRVAVFYQNIDHFEHLIIDLRGTYGETTDFFDHHIIAPLIDSPLTLEVYSFYMASEHNARFIPESLPNHINTAGNTAFKINYTINPSETRRLQNAQIWLLIDQNTKAAAEQATLLLKQAGFATIIGEPTKGRPGVFGNMPLNAKLSLPNTGILISYDFGYSKDIYGNSLEGQPISPNHFNKTGMNAMETALSMIGEVCRQ
jgi:hypothetical protein